MNNNYDLDAQFHSDINGFYLNLADHTITIAGEARPMAENPEAVEYFLRDNDLMLITPTRTGSFFAWDGSDYISYFHNESSRRYGTGHGTGARYLRRMMTHGSYCVDREDAV